MTFFVPDRDVVVAAVWSTLMGFVVSQTLKWSWRWVRAQVRERCRRTSSVETSKRAGDFDALFE